MYKLAFRSGFIRTINGLEPNHSWRTQVPKCLMRLQKGDWTGGLKVKKLGAEGILEARLNGGDRLLFGRAEGNWLVIYDVATHDKTGFLYRRLGDSPAKGDGEGDLLTGLRPPDEDAPTIGAAEDTSPTDPWETLYRTDDLPRFFTPPDEIWRAPDRLAYWADTPAPIHLLLTPEQEQLASAREPVLLNGSAGSGKSTVIIHGLFAHQKKATDLEEGTQNEQQVEVIYVTFLPVLRDNAKTLYDTLAKFCPESDTRLGYPQFLTYTEFCQEMIVKAGRELPPGDLFRERDFYNWYRKWSKGQLRAQCPDLSEAALWCEIRGVIKGRASDSGLPLLTHDEYEQLGERKGTIERNQRKSVLRVASAYQRELKDACRHDEMDLARAARAAVQYLPKENSHWRLGALFCDEVQDLTHAQLSVLFDLRDIYNPYLFLAGDAHQVIYPSAFSWSDLTTFRFHDSQHYQEKTLGRNFRSSGAILHAAKVALTGLKRDVMKPYIKEGRWRWDDPPLGADRGPVGRAPVRLSGTEEDCIETLRSLPANNDRAILTRTEDQRDRLLYQLNSDPTHSRVKNELVYTIDEFKGLEADCVVLWRLFAGAPDFWESVTKQKGIGLYEGLTECNRLYVAITRARRYLAVIDLPGDPHPWDLPVCRDAGFTKKGTDWLQEVQAEGGSVLEMTADAAQLEQYERFEQAALAYENAGEWEAAGRCRARWREGIEQWSKAAEEWYQVRRWADAHRCFDKASDHVGVLRCEAEEWYQVRRWADAHRCFDKASDHVGVLRCEAELLEMEGDWDAAAALWQSVGNGPREAVAWEAAGEWDKALSVWQSQPEQPGKLAFALRLTVERLGGLGAATADFCARKASNGHWWKGSDS